MPGFNGTGPRGQGPMTGRGMGYCVMPLTHIRPDRPLLPYPPFGYYYGRPRWDMFGGGGRGFGRGFAWRR